MTASASSSNLDLRPGRELGKYRLVRLLGQGGFGDVWLAENTFALPGEDLEVALKIPREQQADAVRLLAEPKMLRSLSHRNIVRVVTADKSDGVFFVVMEYMSGGSLREMLRERHRLSEGRALQILRQVLQGLAQAHSAHIIHRDVKPENIFFAADGVAKIGDFGLARQLDEKRQAVGKGGSALYKAPEQFAGVATPASDIWAAGVVLYEMLTGAPPFRPGEGEDIADAVRRRALPNVERVGVAVSPPVQALLQRALNKRADERFASAGDMLAALRQAQSSPIARPTDWMSPWTSFTSLTDIVDIGVLGDHVFLAGGGLRVYQKTMGELTAFHSEHGLPGNAVTAMHATHHEIWLGTDCGAARYDREAQRWDLVTDRDGLLDSRVTAIAQDDDDVWLGSPSGLSRFHRRSHSWSYITQADTLPDPYVTSLACDDGGLWVGTRAGLCRREKWTDRWTVYGPVHGLPQETIHRIVCHHTEVFVATDSGVHKLQGPPHRWVRHPSEQSVLNRPAHALTVDSERIWLAGEDGGVWRYDRAADAAKRFTIDDGLPDNRVITLTAEPDNVWAATKRGVARFDSSLQSWCADMEAAALTSNRVRAVDIDDDHVWAATDCGLSRFDRARETWETYDIGAGLPTNDLLTVAAGEHDLWIGTNGRGLLRFNVWDQVWRHFSADDVPLAKVTALCIDGDSVWVGGDTGLSRYNAIQHNWTHYDEAATTADEPITTIAATADSVWVGFYGAGILRYDKHSGGWHWVLDADTWRQLDADALMVDDPRDFAASRWVSCITADDSRLWVGTRAGVAECDCRSQRWRLLPAPSQWSEPEVVALTRAGNDLWIGGNHGLLRRSIDTGAHTMYTIADGLAHNVVNDIAVSGHEVWTATAGGGLSRFNTAASA